MTADLIFLLQAFVVVTIPFALSRALKLSGAVPLVVIQILLGIALGPSLFGRIAPDAYRLLFNPATLGPLTGTASIAVLFFSFITGLHVDTEIFRGGSRSFAAIAAASVAVPTLLGIVGGLVIGLRHPGELGEHADLVRFSCAIGICVGVTALPVLAAILGEMDLLGDRIGDLALGIAAVNDATLWLLLAGLMTLVAGGGKQRDILFLLLALPTYLLVMVRVVKPLLAHAVAAIMRDGTMSEAVLVMIGAAAIGSAMVTQIIGLHYIFGAFLAGAIVPRELRQTVVDRLQAMTINVLMPFFFMLTGLRILIIPSSAAFIEVLLVTTVLGMLGKVGGTAATAMMMGERWRSALSLGALVQTKGLMEVIVLTILLEHGIISTTVFSALTVMAVISTALVMPSLRLLLPRTEEDRPRRPDIRDALRWTGKLAPAGIDSRVVTHPSRERDRH
jgi:Kef-type K+ transport system membrane component KefB